MPVVTPHAKKNLELKWSLKTNLMPPVVSLFDTNQPKPTRNDSWGENIVWDATPATVVEPASAKTIAMSAAPASSTMAPLATKPAEASAAAIATSSGAALQKPPPADTAASPKAPKQSEDWAAVGAAEIAAAVEKLNVADLKSSHATALVAVAPAAAAAPKYNFKELIAVDGDQIQVTSTSLSQEHLKGEKEWKDIRVENVEPAWDRQGVISTHKVLC